MKSIGEILSWSNFDSPLEQKLFYSLREFGLIAEGCYPIEIFFIDLAFPEKKLAIEVDGFRFHVSKENKQRDAYKDKRLKASGWAVERFSGWFVYRHTDVAAAKIALKYFGDKLTQSQKHHALGLIAGFFGKDYPELSKKLLDYAM